jgi:hypothetical protein
MSAWAMCVASGFSQADAYAQADIALSAGQEAGLYTRFSTTGWYRVRAVGTTGGNAVYILSVYSGGVVTDFPGVTASGTGTLRLETVGTSQKVFLGNTLILSANDASVSAAGTVAIRMGNGGTLDNFQADQVAASTARPLADSFTATANGQLDDTKWYDFFNTTTDASGAAASASSATAIAVARGFSQADAYAQGDVNLAAGQEAGLYTRFSNSGWYRVRAVGVGGGKASYTLSVYSGGVVSDLISATASSTGTLRLETVATSQKVFLGSTLILSANDASVSGAGSVAIRMGNGGTLDNFQADQVAASTALPLTDSFTATANGQLDDTKWYSFYNATTDASGAAASASSATAIAVARGFSQADAYAQADINLASGQEAGLYTRFSNTGWYRARAVGTTGGNATYTLSVYSPATGVVDLGSVTASGTGTLRLETVGTSQKVFLGNTLILSANDASVTAAGTVAIRMGNGGTLHNFSADQIAASAALPLTDSFTATGTKQLDDTKWYDFYNTTTTAGNNAASASSATAIAVARGFSQADDYAQGTIALTSGQEAGLYTRFSSSGWYRVRAVGTTGGNAVYILSVYSGGVVTDFPGVTASGTGTLRLETVGRSQKVFLGNTLILSANDGSVTGPGTVGIRMGNGGTISNFQADQVAASTALPLTDSFNQTATKQLDDTKWYDFFGNFSTSGNVAASASSAYAIAVARSFSQADAYAQAAVALTNGQVAGMYARFSNTGWYRVEATGTSGGNAVYTLSVLTGGTVVPLGSATASGTGTLRLEVKGATQKVYLGATLLISKTDGSVTGAGTVGIRAAAGGTLDNFAADVLA